MPRQLVMAVIALVVASALVVPLAHAMQPLLEAGAVLAIALGGLWLIATAPFRRL
jgi:hypothetical protein